MIIKPFWNLEVGIQTENKKFGFSFFAHSASHHFCCQLYHHGPSIFQKWHSIFTRSTFLTKIMKIHDTYKSVHFKMSFWCLQINQKSNENLPNAQWLVFGFFVQKAFETNLNYKHYYQQQKSQKIRHS